MEIRWINLGIGRLLKSIFDRDARFAEDLENSTEFYDLRRAITRIDHRLDDAMRDMHYLSCRDGSLQEQVDHVVARTARPVTLPPVRSDDTRLGVLDASIKALRFELAQLGLRVSTAEGKVAQRQDATDIRKMIEREISGLRNDFAAGIERLKTDVSAIKREAVEAAEYAASGAIDEALQSPAARALALSGVANLSKRFSQDLERR